MEQKSFQYSFAQKNGMIVVSLSGEMNGFVLPALEACRHELFSKEDVRQVILFFQGVPEISSDAVPWIAQIQRDIRLRKAEVRLVALNSSCKERFIKMGVVRGTEVTEDLKSALMSFVKVAA
ncbi:STAS domain-containing protein [Bdellovibrio reynosensis]|uniref:STAS domain-containing protein n=1 Tax=Bdellovibrio reynosensis TaxID=2835041 RepID=A0ABY4CCP9_9BACT|nr:STAS domain-containing protein [Bdellovibrio reynosensis]UOF02499.1 STAS domain-containing protein [Bdellovibrio reynosensis]